MSAKWIVRIDGSRFNTLEEFFVHFAEKALDGSFWGKNLDAFNDVLRGGFGTPEGGFVIEWQNHERSKECLGFDETIRQLQLRLLRCHSSNVARVTEQLMAARRREGSTVFDWVVEIIQRHCPGGDEATDGIELVLR
jgi:RNAse (barnase) inhibitor barstar